MLLQRQFATVAAGVVRHPRRRLLLIGQSSASGTTHKRPCGRHNRTHLTIPSNPPKKPSRVKPGEDGGNNHGGPEIWRRRHRSFCFWNAGKTKASRAWMKGGAKGGRGATFARHCVQGSIAWHFLCSSTDHNVSTNEPRSDQPLWVLCTKSPRQGRLLGFPPSLSLSPRKRNLSVTLRSYIDIRTWENEKSTDKSRSKGRGKTCWV